MGWPGRPRGIRPARIEEATLTASWIEALTERQTVGSHVVEAGSEVDVSQLVDTLRVRLGNERVFRLSPVESDIPERSARRVAATSRSDGSTWPKDLPRPARLLSPPEQVHAIAEIPDITAGQLEEAAGVLAICSTTVGDQAELAERYAARAVALLGRAFERNHREVAGSVIKNKKLEVLRSREDFQKLIQESENRLLKSATQRQG